MRTRWIPTALAFPLVALLAAAAGAQPTTQPIGLGEAVTLDLPELGAQVRRQKQLDPTTGATLRHNVAILGGAAMEVPDATVREMLRSNTAAYRARVGAITPEFLLDVQRARVVDPGTPIPVAVQPRIDASLLPARPSFETVAALSEEEQALFEQQFFAAIAQVVADQTAAAEARLNALGGEAVVASRILPQVFARLTPAQILALKDELLLVERVHDGRIELEDDVAEAACSVGSDTVLPQVNPGGIRVAVIERGRTFSPLACVDVVGTFGFELDDHATFVGGVIASTLASNPGIAAGADILGADIGDKEASDIEAGFEWGIANGADVFNMSGSSGQSGQIEAEDVMADWLVRTYARFLAKSAGNKGNSCDETGEVTSPGNGWNVMAVGNYDDQGTCSPFGDTMNPGSCDGDPASPHGDREKPDVAAPGTSIQSITPSCGVTSKTGTSFSAPVVAGGAALLIARNAGVAWWPELTRALLMASATKNLEGSARLSESDGAGGVRIDQADRMLTDGTWLAKTIGENDLDGNGAFTLGSFQVLPQTERIKAAIAWDSNPDEAPFWFGGNMLVSEFDLQLWRGGTLVQASSSFDNSFEVIDVEDPPAGSYTLRVVAFGDVAEGDTSEYFGGAWQVLRDPCADAGFDQDGDGVCSAIDNCVLVANPEQWDFDLDGVGDACDNCVLTANPDQANNDGDAAGDACDPDDDNDGCPDVFDDDPLRDVVRKGRWIGPTCPGGSGTTWGPANGDPDKDGIPNCMDPNDDGDDWPDSEDDCPLTPGNDVFLCTEFRDCPVQVWWDVCLFGGCDEFFTKLTQAINPDPTLLQFESMEILNQSLALLPPAGVSALEAIDQLAGGGGGGGGGAAPRGPAEALRLELWRRGRDGGDDRFVALVAEYLPSDLVVGETGPGAWIVIDPTDLQDPVGTSLIAATTWSPGSPPGASPPDGDGDGWPDPFDNCAEASNPDQVDTNGDAIGNRCDPDYNDDGRVGIPDFAALRAGFGATCTERGYDPDLDSDANCAVGLSDFNLLRGRFGDFPGPSGIVCPREDSCPAP
ncbi:MAG: S8 family serine peptidase [Myxococcota bacterium]|nr:S8 family serine peptidase [Myxococcota bacterium]